ncbi:MAG: hypothetical protein QF903_11850 [Planctomycetota bacterium]|jgi:hypothetical protein|nr:hypothetical protein [Planctomycetota bacterium]MDP6763719.1 hypothetical protein [Planctomycetota bacterium]MDP6990154.1 hypothetical protein [Planctomycetota bacterium]
MANPPSPVAALDPASPIAGVPLEAALLILGIVACALLAVILWRLRLVGERLEALEALDPLGEDLERLAETAESLDLGRLEHLVSELRDSQKRLNDRLALMAEERGRSGDAAAAPAQPVPLGERITNRLLAMDYEGIQLLPGPEGLAEDAAEADVLVEARRGGAFCKGRVRVRDGVIAEVDLRTAHSMFP